MNLQKTLSNAFNNSAAKVDLHQIILYLNFVNGRIYCVNDNITEGSKNEK